MTDSSWRSKVDLDHEAVLCVLSEPGAAVKLEEFHQWYDEEHVPLRMSSLPEFLSGARYEPLDDLKPTFLALYDISKVDLFASPRYTDLRKYRSTREAELLSRIGTLDRRTYRTVLDCRARPRDDYSPFVITVETDERSEELQNELQSAVGWQRTQVCELIDSSITGSLQPPSTDAYRIPSKIIIIELEDQNYELPMCLRKVLSDGSKGLITNVRQWKLQRGWRNSVGRSSTG